MMDIRKLKIQELLHNLKLSNSWNPEGYMLAREELEMVMKALEKQMAKKPENINGLFICPRCKGRRLRSGDYFCIECGQAIDWE